MTQLRDRSRSRASASAAARSSSGIVIAIFAYRGFLAIPNHTGYDRFTQLGDSTCDGPKSVTTDHAEKRRKDSRIKQSKGELQPLASCRSPKNDPCSSVCFRVIRGKAVTVAVTAASHAASSAVHSRT